MVLPNGISTLEVYKGKVFFGDLENIHNKQGLILALMHLLVFILSASSNDYND